MLSSGVSTRSEETKDHKPGSSLPANVSSLFVFNQKQLLHGAEPLPELGGKGRKTELTDRGGRFPGLKAVVRYMG